MANIGSLAVQMSGNTNRFNRDMKGARGTIMRLGGAARMAGAAFVRLSGLMTVAGTAIVGFASVGIKRAADQIDRMAQVSDRLGLSTESFTALAHGAEIAGIETNKLELGLQRMTRRVSEAAQGTGEAQNAIKELGLDAAQLNAMSPDKQFMAIAEAMSLIPNQADRIRLGFKLFDSEGVDLIRLMDRGSQGIADFMAEAEQLGLTFSRFDASRVEEANDAMTRLRAAFRGAFNILAIELAPIISTAINKLVEMGTAGEGTAERIHSGFSQAVNVIGVIGNALSTINRFLKQMSANVNATFGTILRSVAKAQEFLNKLAGFDKAFTGIDADKLNELADIQFTAYRIALAELNELEFAPKLGDRFKAFVEEVKAETSNAVTPQGGGPVTDALTSARRFGQSATGNAALLGLGNVSQSIQQKTNNLLAKSLEYQRVTAEGVTRLADNGSQSASYA